MEFGHRPMAFLGNGIGPKVEIDKKWKNTHFGIGPNENHYIRPNSKHA